MIRRLMTVEMMVCPGKAILHLRMAIFGGLNAYFGARFVQLQRLFTELMFQEIAK